MSIKVKQKLGKDSIAKLQAQLKSTGVKVITHVTDGFVTADDVLGRVTSIFDLHTKLDFITNMKKEDEKASFKVSQLQGDFYLMRDEH